MASALNNLLTSEVFGKWTAGFDLPDAAEAEEINPDSEALVVEKKRVTRAKSPRQTVHVCRRQRWTSGTGSSWSTCPW